MKDDAEKLYEEFHDFGPKNSGRFANSCRIPDRPLKLGRAIHVVYRSDKWDKKVKDYIHEHEAGVGLYVSGGRDDAKTPAWLSDLNDGGTLTYLGKCLEVAFQDDSGISKVNLKVQSTELYAHPSGRSLFVVGARKQIVAIIYGGHLNVTARGIVG